MSLILKDLIERGYFPQELPPPFRTESFSNFVHAGGSLPGYIPPPNTPGQKQVAGLGQTNSIPGVYNLARVGLLRRVLSIPNPVHFLKLAEYVVTNWAKISTHFGTTSLSLSIPTLGSEGRAIARRDTLAGRASKKVEVRSKGRYLVIADIARFYPGIYTHSIPWAIDGKAIAKKNRKKSTLGNDIDALVRNCQGQQTNGIPIGPDTSLLIAEIILSKVDEKIVAKGYTGFRYVDDYELVFNTKEEAQRALDDLQQLLFEYELYLNPSKSMVLELPQRFEDEWISELRTFEINPESRGFRTALIHFFDRAFELSRKYPTENILKYASGRVSFTDIHADDYAFIEDLLIQCARVEAGALPIVLRSVLKFGATDQNRKEVRENLMNWIIREHAPQRHTSEVAWALWACVTLKFKLSEDVCKLIVLMEDSICALLLLHARSEGLVPIAKLLDPLAAVLNGAALYEDRWMLAYEAETRGWLTSKSGQSMVDADPNFSLLKTANVSFYDESKTVISEDDDELEYYYISRLETGDYNEDEDEDELAKLFT